VKKLKDLLKNFKPGSTTPTTTTTTTTTTDNGCEGGSCEIPCENCETTNCDELKAQVAELTSNVNELTETVQALTAKVNSLTNENNNLKKTISNVQSKWVTVLKNIESLDEEIKAL
jgi:peptidoglycan hydrolase CwlO-like protein